MKLRDILDMMTAVNVGTESAYKRSGSTVSRAEYMKLYDGYNATFNAFKELYDERQETEKRVAELEAELADTKKELSAWQAIGKRQEDDRSKTISIIEQFHSLLTRPKISKAGIDDDIYDALYELFHALGSIYDSLTDYCLFVDSDDITYYYPYLESEMLCALMRGFAKAVNQLSESDALCRLFTFPDLYPLDEDGNALEYLLSLMETRLSEISKEDTD